MLPAGLHLLNTFCVVVCFVPGFPGESDEAHRELVEFVRDFKFERMGAFAYSEEDGTPAADLPEQLPQRKRWGQSVTQHGPR